MANVMHINTAHLVLREAADAAENRASKSYIINPKKYQSIPRISHKELVLGNHLACGSFNDVFEVREINAGNTFQHQQMSDSEETVAVCSVEDDLHESFEVTTKQSHHILMQGKNRYVIKILTRGVVSNLPDFRTGSTDLLLEAQYLASLDHPNIISLRGVADDVMGGLISGLGGGYFLLLDRLHCTLERRIAKWRHQQKARHPFRKRRGKESDNIVKRLHIASELAEALRYLHSLGIVYRDLKPENVGFCKDGTLKLFDFGLAKELHSSKRLPDDLYRMTGNTGSLRYMAPEVGRNMPYNLTADVYSLAVLLWELCSLQQPYEGMDKESHADLVLYGRYRPRINEEWPEQVRQLMIDGWSEDLGQRPRMETIRNVLRKEIRCGLERSFSMQGPRE